LQLASEVHVAGLMTGKSGTLHLHLRDGARGLELLRAALDSSELPARVFHPTHVNRRSALFEEAPDLAELPTFFERLPFDPLAPEQIDRLKRNMLRTAQRLLGMGGVRPVSDLELKMRKS
jgi:hypothetical protein